MEVVIAVAIAFTIMVAILGAIDMAIHLFCKKCDKSKPKAGNLL